MKKVKQQFVFPDTTEFGTGCPIAEQHKVLQRRCELSKGLASRARMLYANLESNREPERARASKREPERAGEQARESQREAGLTS